jgi:NAD(P)-dependent dehydrogenase (short-subunit alcohol dehydrogenase family)
MSAVTPPLAGKVCVITGASRGIGRGAALEFARLGCDLVIAARTETPFGDKKGTLTETAAEIGKFGRQLLAVRCDVGKQADLENLVSRTLEHFGRCDILVNNAAVTGGLVFVPLASIRREQFEKFLAVNLTAPLMLSQKFSEGMKARGSGLIINLTSGAGNLEDVANPRGVHVGLSYGSTKAALNRLGNAMARELLPSGVVCVTVDPGFTATQDHSTEAAMDSQGWTDRPRAHPVSWPVTVMRYLATTPDIRQYAGKVLVTDEFVKEKALV